MDEIFITLFRLSSLFSRHDLVVHELAQSHSYDLTLLLDVDVPWVDDPIRYAQDDRLGFMTRFVEKLSEFNRPFVRLSGDWDNRFEIASQKVESILASQTERLFWRP